MIATDGGKVRVGEGGKWFGSTAILLICIRDSVTALAAINC